MIEQSFTIDMDLCALLNSMRLDKTKEELVDDTQAQHVQDVLMSDDASYHSDASTEALPCPSVPEREMHGCAYLQALLSQVDNYQTTGGEYLEAIFTHREILFTHPRAHQECARGFSDLAYVLEQRAWRADRDADIEAVVAFRNEAWTIASSYSPPSQPQQISRSATLPCVMMPML